jgi:DNA/RNA endonuclease YhcR with UshA esterase domain
MSFRNFAGRHALPLLLAGALLAGCEPDTSPPFTIDEPGAVEGLLFFDADEDAVFDPSDGDYALQGVRLTFRVRGTEQVLGGGTITSDATGRFAVDNLPAGTHDAYVDPASLPAGVILCANPVQVTVEPGVRRFLRLQARGGCLVLIGTAEALDPAAAPVVVIRGIVTSAPSMMRAGGDYTYIQDASGGLRIFGSSLATAGLEVGDRLEVSGNLGIFSGDLQLSNPTVRAITKNFGAVTPQATTTGAIAAAGPQAKAALQGTLVKVTAAKLTGAFGSGGINIRNAIIDDGSGATQIRFETGLYANTADLTAAYTVGKCYDVTGVVGNFNGAGQLFPRQRSDVVEVPCP